MKTLKIAVIVMMWVVMAQSPLFSIIYGRIEGFVRDKETGQVLANVQVILHTLRDDLGETRTDKKGFFVFNKVKPGNNYYIICREDNHFSNVPEYLCDDEMMWIDIPRIRQAVGVFNLKEGETRKMDIRLEKGGMIKGKILQNNADGIKPFEYVAIKLLKKYEEKDIFSSNSPLYDNITIGHFFIRENGEFFFPGLRPSDNYSIIIEPHRYFASQFIRDIEVRGNETHFIEFTFDFLSRTGIKGTVTKNGIPLKSVYISIYRIPGSEDFGSMKTDQDGKYSILMMQPGLYKIEYGYFDKDDVEHEKVVKINIETDEIKIINIEF